MMVRIPTCGRLLAAAVFTTFLTGCLDSSSSSSDDDTAPSLSLSALSSDPSQVSGNSVLIGVSDDDGESLTDINQLELWLNDTQIDPTIRAGRHGAEILVQGLPEGANRIELHHTDHGPLSELNLEVYPVTGPMFSGPQQYPFVCTVTTELGKQPLVDTTGNEGFPVLDEDDNQIGLSPDFS